MATKDDLRVLGAELRTEVGDLRTELAESLNRQIRWMVTFNTALAGTVLTAAGLRF